ncbi:MAG: ABC transporter ATP-binding protein [Pseudomonadota bacterium]
MGAISLEAIEKWYGNVPVIKGIDLTIHDGEFIVFVGPSGCGKSTLLRMIGGLEDISCGALAIDGVDVTDHPPAKRGLSMVFQSYALYPHMSVRDNMGFSLKTQGAPEDEITSKVDMAAATLKLQDYLARRPRDLSGGQRQRVAIGRAIVRNPTAFLFDEPLSNLDASLRVEMRYELSKLHQSLGTTMIYVTHDQVEAMTLADRIVVLDAGKLIQCGTPSTLYNQPDNIFVAQFIGSPKMNVMTCQVGAGKFSVSNGPHHDCPASAKDATQLGIRPEHITLVAPGSGHCDAMVQVVEYLGADSFILLECGNIGQITVRAPGDTQIKPQESVGLQFQDDRIIFFDAQGLALR